LPLSPLLGTSFLLVFLSSADTLPTHNSAPYGPGPDYFHYQILNSTNTTETWLPTDESEFESLILEALQTDPGQTNAEDPNIEEFLNRGKLLTVRYPLPSIISSSHVDVSSCPSQFVGLADTLIASGSTHLYWHEVQAALGYRNLSDSYRMVRPLSVFSPFSLR
jgi:feruloyl esterase